MNHDLGLGFDPLGKCYSSFQTAEGLRLVIKSAVTLVFVNLALFLVFLHHLVELILA